MEEYELKLKVRDLKAESFDISQPTITAEEINHPVINNNESK
jgi:hypothetical protein